MTRNIAETLIGAVVLLVAAGFLFFAYDSANMQAVDGYPIAAKFTAVGSLKTGADVRVSGIRIGTVVSQGIEPDSFLARVDMSIESSISLPEDTYASISQDGLLGDTYIKLEPGGADEMLKAGAVITDTAPAPDLFGLINQLVYSSEK
jgi:phospholipid/cholesterol/gamma-HCH transport system substrate-binding protein